MNDLEVSLPVPCSQSWENMSPQGCNRHCASCDTEIYDLSALTIEEAAKLISAPGGACVRAQVASDGTIALSQGTSSRRMKAVVAGSLALAVAACQTTSVTPLYEISGQITRGQRIELLDKRGLVKTTTANRRGQFTFRNLRAGSYSLRTYDSSNGCEDEAENLVEGIDIVGEHRNLGSLDTLRDNCQVIIVGVMSPRKPHRIRG